MRPPGQEAEQRGPHLCRPAEAQGAAPATRRRWSCGRATCPQACAWVCPSASAFDGPIWLALAEFGHALITGATRSGKSSWIHAALAALLSRNGPDVLRLALVDPKRVEFVRWAHVPHLLGDVAHDEPAPWPSSRICWRDGAARRSPGRGRSARTWKRTTSDAAEPLPYILLVVDEVLDLGPIQRGREWRPDEGAVQPHGEGREPRASSPGTPPNTPGTISCLARSRSTWRVGSCFAWRIGARRNWRVSRCRAHPAGTRAGGSCSGTMVAIRWHARLLATRGYAESPRPIPERGVHRPYVDPGRAARGGSGAPPRFVPDRRHLRGARTQERGGVSRDWLKRTARAWERRGWLVGNPSNPTEPRRMSDDSARRSYRRSRSEASEASETSEVE